MYTYNNSLNRFGYLGNGFTPLEEAGGDRTFDLGARTDRMDSHPALLAANKGTVKAARKEQKVMIACEPAAVILGSMAVAS